MAKFLNTKKAVSEIEDLIRDAGHRLILISPYLKLSKDFRDLLTYRNSQDKITVIVFGKQELNPDEMKFLRGLQFVSLKYNEDLHAKCYANEEKMIITSLNLYEFSMINNKEMGVLIDKNDSADFQLFEDASKEIDYIERTSQRFEFGELKPSAGSSAIDKNQKVISPQPMGYCIRTGVQIPFNVEKPLSYDAYKSWSKFGDPNYAEKFCHFSGEPSNGETSVSKPILKKNWQKAKETFGL